MSASSSHFIVPSAALGSASLGRSLLARAGFGNPADSTSAQRHWLLRLHRAPLTCAKTETRDVVHTSTAQSEHAPKLALQFQCFLPYNFTIHLAGRTSRQNLRDATIYLHMAGSAGMFGCCFILQPEVLRPHSEGFSI